VGRATVSHKRLEDSPFREPWPRHLLWCPHRPSRFQWQCPVPTNGRRHERGHSQDQACHFLLRGKGFCASTPGPVQAERSESEGSKSPDNRSTIAPSKPTGPAPSTTARPRRSGHLPESPVQAHGSRCWIMASSLRFFSDRERLNQHSHVSQIARRASRRATSRIPVPPGFQR
jgi:hypothetical protein